jgi:hypothetical protein
MRAPKRNRWRLRDHLSRRILTGGARCLREQRGVHHGERHDGAAPFRRQPGSDAGDRSAGSRSTSRRCRGAPSAGNTDVSLPADSRTDRPTAITSRRSIVLRERGAAILDRGSQRQVAAPRLESRSCRGPVPPGQRLVRTRREPVNELLELVGGGPQTAPAPGNPAVLSSSELLR